jgi:hypothetical protein
MSVIKTGAGVARRPPSNAKLTRLLEDLDSTGNELGLWTALVATLTERAGVTISTAKQMLRRAEKEVGRDHETNLPADRSPAVLGRVSAAMDAWFAPEVVAHTLALAREGMPRTAWSSGERHGVTPSQSDERPWCT